MIDPPGDDGVERKVLRVPGKTITPELVISTLAFSICCSNAQNELWKFAGSIAVKAQIGWGDSGGFVIGVTGGKLR